jgi:hypothetical protein
MIDILEGMYDKLHNEKVIFVFYVETLFIPYSKKQNNLSSRSLEQNKTLSRVEKNLIYTLFKKTKQP